MTRPQIELPPLKQIVIKPQHLSVWPFFALAVALSVLALASLALLIIRLVQEFG